MMEIFKEPWSIFMIHALAFTILAVGLRWMARTKTETGWVRKKAPLGWLDWGKAHFLWIAVLYSLSFLVPDEVMGERAMVGSPFITGTLMTFISIGIHSASKNLGQSDPVALIGNVFGKIVTKIFGRWTK